MKEKIKDYERVFVIGAGFSKPARLPVCDELFKEIIEEAKSRDLYDGLEVDINSFIEYQLKAKGKTVAPNEVNFEEFISYLDIEHFLRLQGNDYYSEEGYPSQLIVKNLIAQILYRKQSEMQDEDFALYEGFAERLKPRDTIITFNYDTILENTFSRMNIPYRLHPTRYEKIIAGEGISIDTDEIILLKMHGSIDWFDISAYDREQKSFRDLPSYISPPSHNIFARKGKSFDLEKIIAEPYFAESPLQKIYRNFDLKDYLKEDSYTSTSPLIISPSHSKMVYLSPLTEFWEGYNKAGLASGAITIIGFSLPEHDEYIRQPLYHSINNFQNNHYFEEVIEKTNLKMIDYKQSQSAIDAYKKNYSFVDWNRTDCYFNGFNEESLEVIFGK